MPAERLKVSAPDDSSDDDWDPEEGAGATDEEDSDAEDSGADGGAKRGRVTAHYIVQRSSGLEEHDDRRKSLAEKTWARRWHTGCPPLGGELRRGNTHR